MKIYTYYFIFSCLIFFVTGCSEDTIDDNGLGNITGIVVEEGTNDPVANVKISTNPVSSTVFSNEDGKFTLNNVPTGDYSIQAKKDGLQTNFEGANVLANTTVEVVFEMQKETAGNKQPSIPTAVSPEDNASGVTVPVKLSWDATDKDDDELTYTLQVRNTQDEKVILVEDIADTTYTVEGLQYDTQYFWQISASDGVNPEVYSPFYAFKTLEVSENRILFTRLINGNQVIFARDSEGEEAIQINIVKQ